LVVDISVMKIILITVYIKLLIPVLIIVSVISN